MPIFLLIGLGLAVGVVSGVLGIGGGILLVPALIWLLDLQDFRRASGLSLVALVLPVTLPGVFRYYAQGTLRGEDFLAGLWIALGLGVGTWLGATTAWYLPVATLRLLFGLMLIFVAFRFLLAADSDAYAGYYGLVGVILAWLAFLGLRTLGRRHRRAPTLAEHVRTPPAPTEPGDYSI